MKPKAGTEVFELIPSQKMINFMLKYSFFHKQVIQIPMSIVTHTPIDFNVLKKALNIEIERNDCMRLRFYKEHGEFYQYFLDKYVVDDVPVVTFSTEEEQQAYLTADARRPICHLKGEDFRIIFFHSFDGGYGIYINITHLCMDAAAVFVFFSDLLGVYDHLKNGKPMPRPLGEYKKTIRKELAIVADEKKMKEEEEFYTQFFLKDGDPLYAGVHGPELLEKERKRKHDPSLRAPSCFDPIHDKAELARYDVSKEDSDKILAFIQSSGVSPECLVQLAMRLHISKINYRTNDSYFVTLCTRRRTLSEKRSGGTLAEPLPWRIVLPETLTFSEALDKMAELQMTLFRHMDYPYLECRELVRKLFDYSPIAASSSMMFSWFPLSKDTMNGWDYEFTGYSLGRYIMPLYSFAMYDAHSGCFKFSYMHRTNMITSEHIKALHEKTVRALLLGAENPDRTLGEILDIL